MTIDYYQSNLCVSILNNRLYKVSKHLIILFKFVKYFFSFNCVDGSFWCLKNLKSVEYYGPIPKLYGWRIIFIS